MKTNFTASGHLTVLDRVQFLWCLKEWQYFVCSRIEENWWRALAKLASRDMTSKLYIIVLISTPAKLFGSVNCYDSWHMCTHAHKSTDGTLTHMHAHTHMHADTYTHIHWRHKSAFKFFFFLKKNSLFHDKWFDGFVCTRNPFPASEVVLLISCLYRSSLLKRLNSAEQRLNSCQVSFLRLTFSL